MTDIQPRLIRLKDASRYVGMDKNRFDSEVRPHLVEIPIGKQGIAFDRLDLDAWVDQYKCRSGRPGSQKEGDSLWDVKKYQVCRRKTESGTLINKSSGDVFAKALAQVTSKRRKNT